MAQKYIKQLIKRAVEAVESEIETVRQKPARDVLFQGKLKEHHPQGAFYYEFESQNTSLRFAEEIRGELEGVDDELDLHTVEYGDKKVVLHFPHNYGQEIDKVSLEWENDFVLRKLRMELEYITDTKNALERIGRLFGPDPEKHHANSEVRVIDDSRRNKSQAEAMRKALQNNVLYVWGPPGTGKTSTLGFIIANYLVKGKRVLFASNTNRAVDVGVLSTIQALEAVEKEHLEEDITRFGEIALDDARLEQVFFERQAQEKKQEMEQQAARLKAVLDKYRSLQKEIDELMEQGEDIPEELDRECVRLADEVEAHGGEDALEEQIDRMTTLNERVELERRQMVATTLAKVCTSDLFGRMEFDAVVVDEASMANLPYLMVLAAKAKKHMVVVGDPMQLPPIALTEDAAARKFLEHDIFTFVSGAESAEDLFGWHDKNRPLTAFFDIQYRMSRDLAEILSSVFYEGRLKTVDLEEPASTNGHGKESGVTVSVIDSGKYGSRLTQKDGGKGFSPVNEIHLQLLKELIRRLLLKKQVPPEEIGIIVPFRNTVYDIRDALYGEGYENVEVGTIHTFQGREKRVIIFDTVMSGEVSGGRKRHYSVRPFDEDKTGMSVARLLNVAFSRSREQLVVVADMDHIHRMYGNKILGKLLDKFREVEGRI